jgi:hypothetical protein
LFLFCYENDQVAADRAYPNFVNLLIKDCLISETKFLMVLKQERGCLTKLSGQPLLSKEEPVKEWLRKEHGIDHMDYAIGAQDVRDDHLGVTSLPFKVLAEVSLAKSAASKLPDTTW